MMVKNGEGFLKSSLAIPLLLFQFFQPGSTIPKVQNVSQFDEWTNHGEFQNCELWQLNDGSMEEVQSDLNFKELDLNSYRPYLKVPPTLPRDKMNQRLEVIIVPHSHNDPGWLETYETYYKTTTKDILTQTLAHLSDDPTLKFIWSNMAFFTLWWEDLSPEDRVKVQKIVESKQLEIVSGGWVVPDEATTHYYSLMVQLTEGQTWLYQHLNYRPKNGWSIDPFGMSPVNAYLLHRSGLKTMVINRIHYVIKDFLEQKQELEFKWRQTWTAESDMLCHVLSKHYSLYYVCPNSEVCCEFDFFFLPGVSGQSCLGRYAVPITDQNLRNQAIRLTDQFRKKASHSKTNILLIPLGDDFRWRTSAEWDAQIGNHKKLMDYINSQPEFNMDIRIGSLQDYFEKVNDLIETKEVNPKSLTGDFFPYADQGNDYWTGYYTSGPFHKFSERQLVGILRSAQIAFSLMSGEVHSKHRDFSHFPAIQNMMERIVKSKRHLALFQHHDAITGTEREQVALNYAQKLFEAHEDCQHVLQQSLHILHNLQNPHFVLETIQSDSQFSFPIFYKDNPMDLTKVRVAAMTDRDNSRGILVFNPETRKVTRLVSLHVNTCKVQVEEFSGNPVEHEILPVFTKDGRAIETTIFKLSFLVSIQSLQSKQFVLKFTESSSTANVAQIWALNGPSQNIAQGQNAIFSKVQELSERDVITLANEYMTLSLQYDSKTDELSHRMAIGGTEIPFGIKFMAYRRTTSGMYLFHPSGPAQSVPLKQDSKDSPKIILVKGKWESYFELLLPLVTHRITLYNYPGMDSRALHIQNVVDLRQETNTELIMRIQTDIQSQDKFYTDLNGFHMMKRQRKPDALLTDNYYPIPTAMYIEDPALRLTVLTAQPLGGSSLNPGQLEIMLDRHVNKDDGRGLAGSYIENVETESKFKILFEIPCSTATPQNQVPMLSPLANLHLQSLLNPLQTFLTPQLDLLELTGRAAEYSVGSSRPLPWDTELVGLFPLSVPSRPAYGPGSSVDIVAGECGMVIRKFGFDSRFQYPGFSSMGEEEKEGFSVGWIWSELVESKVNLTNLNFIQTETQGLDRNGEVEVKRMELVSFRVKYAKPSEI